MATDSFKVRRSLNIEPVTAPSLTAEGDVGVNSTDNEINAYLGGASRVVVTEDQTQTLTNKTIDADSNTISNIENADIKASAGIDFSKLATLTSGNILVGSAGNVATSVAMSGDATIVAAGTLTVANDAISNAKLANMAESTIKGRAVSAGTGDPTDLTATQATAILNAFVGDSGSGGTKGLVPAPASGDAAANKFLKADGNWADPSGTLAADFISDLSTVTPQDVDHVAIADASDSGNAKKALISGIKTPTIRSLTTTDTVAITDDILFVSGSAFTLTMYDAATGYKPVQITKTDTSLSNIITLARAGSDVFYYNGTSYTSLTLNTVNESWLLVPVSGGFRVVQHDAVTEWADIDSTEGVLITATVTAPEYGTVVINKAQARRTKDSLEVRWDYRQSATTGSTAGSGMYLFNLPSGYPIDTTKAPANTSTSGGAAAFYTSLVGRFTAVTTSYVTGNVVVYSGSQLKIDLPSGAWGSVVAAFNSAADRAYSLQAVVPISGWYA